MKARFNPLNPTATAIASPTTAVATKKAPTRKPARRSTQKKRPARTSIDATEALTRALNDRSYANYSLILQGFAAKGIPMDEIKPRENVFTFNAWKAQGRVVKKGERGIRIATVLNIGREKVDPESGQVISTGYTRPWSATVFHISQTIPLEEAGRPEMKPEIKPAPPTPIKVDFKPAPKSTIPFQNPTARPSWRDILKAQKQLPPAKLLSL